MAGTLQRIRFKSFSSQVMSIQHISRILITWELEPTVQDLKNLRFFIDRGESPETLSVISTPISPLGLFEYMDFTPRMIDTARVYYYRIRAVEFDPTLVTPLQTFQTPPFTWDTDLDLVGLYVVEEHIFAHRYVYGVPTCIFKKKRDGEYCPDCFDTVLKRVTRSNCTTCFGTGKLGGYYPLIEAWMDFNPDPKVGAVQDRGEVQPSQTDFQFTNYPVLNIGDIIIEIQPNWIWKVANVRATEKRRSLTLQIGRVDAVNRSDIEYQLSVPDEVKRRLVKDLEAIRQEREF